MMAQSEPDLLQRATFLKEMLKDFFLQKVSKNSVENHINS